MIINMNGAKAPETPSPVMQEKTVTPETLPVVIGADEGYDGLSQVTVNPDAQLIPTNIRSGKTIFGVDGTFVGEAGTPDPEQVFWQNVANRPNDDIPIGYSGVLHTPRLQRAQFYNCAINEDGLRFDSLESGGGESFKFARQYHKNENGEVIDGGDIELNYINAFSSIFEHAVLKSLPTGTWKFTSPHNSDGGVFKYTTFLHDIELTENHVNDGEYIVRYSLHRIYKVTQYSTGASNLTLTLPAKNIIISDDGISGDSYPNVYLNLIVKSETPYQLISSRSLRYIKSITVPKGCLETYQTATNWAQFADIMVESN